MATDTATTPMETPPPPMEVESLTEAASRQMRELGRFFNFYFLVSMATNLIFGNRSQ